MKNYGLCNVHACVEMSRRILWLQGVFLVYKSHVQQKNVPILSYFLLSDLTPPPPTFSSLTRLIYDLLE